MKICSRQNYFKIFSSFRDASVKLMLMVWSTVEICDRKHVNTAKYFSWSDRIMLCVVQRWEIGTISCSEGGNPWVKCLWQMKKEGRGGVMNWHGAAMPQIARSKSLQAVTGCHRLFPPLLEGDKSVCGALACYQGEHNNGSSMLILPASNMLEDTELCLCGSPQWCTHSKNRLGSLHRLFPNSVRC